MEKNNRIKNVYINSLFTLFSQLIQVLLGFVVRKLFIEYLGVTYLGYNSVFTSILQMLNLADLGIGIAITSFLYKPLAEKNIVRVASLMEIYKKVYRGIGTIIIIIGLIISIFINYLIPDANCSVEYLRLLFYINLIGTAAGYFLAYKRTLIIADQKSYIASIIDSGICIFASLLQIILLITIPNYIIYLIISILKTIFSNIIISNKANRIYGELKKHVDKNVIKSYKPHIINYVKDVLVSRLGSVVYYSTDNIILSMIKGSLLTGYLSNYTMITSQLNTIVTQVLSSIQSTFGNFIYTHNDREAQKEMTDTYFCANFCIGNFCFICFVLLAQPFVSLFFGQDMLLQNSTIIWLGINLMLTFMIQLPSQVFTIYKLFKYDRPIIIVSATLNIIISIVLVYLIGINGVLIGTFITSLIYLFSRFYVISRRIFMIDYSYYVKTLLFYFGVSVISFLIVSTAVCSMNNISISLFIIKGVFVTILAMTVTAFLLSFIKQFQTLSHKLIPKKIRYYINTKNLLIVNCLLWITAKYICGLM